MNDRTESESPSASEDEIDRLAKKLHSARREVELWRQPAAKNLWISAEDELRQAEQRYGYLVNQVAHTAWLTDAIVRSVLEIEWQKKPLPRPEELSEALKLAARQKHGLLHTPRR